MKRNTFEEDQDKYANNNNDNSDDLDKTTNIMNLQ